MTLLAERELLERLQDRYDQIAATDPTAYHLETGHRTPAELADHIAALVPAITDLGAVGERP